MQVLFACRVGQIPQRLQQQRVFQNPLNRLDQIGLQRAAVLLLRVAGDEELLQRLITLAWNGFARAKQQTAISRRLNARQKRSKANRNRLSGQLAFRCPQ